MKKQKKQRTWVIHLRHIFPAVSDLALIILMLLPTFSFSISGALQPKQSVFDLIANSWRGSREYLFSASAQTTPQGEAMYRAIFIALIALIILFLIGILINICSMIISYRDILSPEENKSIKNIYLAFIPNRIVLSAIRLLVIPIFFLPDIVAYYYRSKLLQAVSVKYVLHPAIIAAVLFLITVVITAISRKYEISEGRDVFCKKTASKADNEDSVTDNANTSQGRVHRISKDEDTAQRVRRMFEDSDK